MAEKMPPTQTINVEYTDDHGNKSVQSHWVTDAVAFMEARFHECALNIEKNTKDSIRSVKLLG